MIWCAPDPPDDDNGLSRNERRRPRVSLSLSFPPPSSSILSLRSSLFFFFFFFSSAMCLSKWTFMCVCSFPSKKKGFKGSSSSLSSSFLLLRLLLLPLFLSLLLEKKKGSSLFLSLSLSLCLFCVCMRLGFFIFFIFFLPFFFLFFPTLFCGKDLVLRCVGTSQKSKITHTLFLVCVCVYDFGTVSLLECRLLYIDARRRRRRSGRRTFSSLDTSEKAFGRGCMSTLHTHTNKRVSRHFCRGMHDDDDDDDTRWV